jgi:Uncharacterised protein family (UPF0158)
MLDLEKVNLGDLALALEDHSPDHHWQVDLHTGEIEPRFGRAQNGDRGNGSIVIEPLPSGVGYGDMEDFVMSVRDPRARHMLSRAITGRGAFRRFKDSLMDYPELRRAWFAFHDARSERRAIDWLSDHGLVDPAAAEEARGTHKEPDPAEMPGVLDAHGILRQLAGELKRLYGRRLRQVILAGAWARGDAVPDSAIELITVVDPLPNPWQEKRRMDRIVSRHSMRHHAVITVLPISPADLLRADTPYLVRATTEGIRIE